MRQAYAHYNHMSLEFRVDIDEDAQEVFERHEETFQTILLHSVNNAVKAIWGIEDIKEYNSSEEPEKYESIEGIIAIKGRLLEEHPFAELSISDTGHGMTQEQADLMMQGRFTKRTWSKERDNGGVGMRVTKQAVEEINGIMGCESEYGKGTTFYYLFPK